jgi:pyruvate dehydrogenase E2 component (dihydrolipoamide acetyltransferase)
MAVFLSMPKLGMNMTSGIIVSWLVKEGSRVETGQPIVEVETDKAINTVESPASGFLARIVKEEGEEVPCTFVMAVIIGPEEEIPSYIPEAITDGIRPTVEVEVRSPSGLTSSSEENKKTDEKRVFISPSARLLAKELGLDLNQVQPVGDKISRKDVELAYKALQKLEPVEQKYEPSANNSEAIETPLPAVKKEISWMRKRIAEHMAASARTVARVGLKVEADAGQLVKLREKMRLGGRQFGYSELLAKLVAEALKEFPYMNAQMVGNEIWEMTDINIGIAVDVEGGLVAPVVQNVDRKNAAEVHSALVEMVERARTGKSLPEDLRGGTFTITNLGSYEIEEFLPIINHPECAILGVGAIVRKPVVMDDQLEIRPRIGLTLAFDHRLVDGAPAARFLQRLKGLVENAIVE